MGNFARSKIVRSRKGWYQTKEINNGRHRRDFWAERAKRA